MKDQIAADLQKAKEAGGARVEKIRQIFRDAFSQSLTELKEGGNEIGSIAKTSTSTLIENLQNQPKATAPEAPIPVEVKIETDEEPVDGADSAAEAVVIAELVETESTAVPGPESVSKTVDGQSDAEAQQPEAADQPLHQVLFHRAVELLKERGIYTKLEQQWLDFKQQLDQLDTKLDEQFGERYTVIKQDFRKDMQTAKEWYDKTRTNASNTGTFWVDQKQAELEVKAGEAGATLAQKEEKIKHLLKELWQTVTRQDEGRG